MNDNTFIKIAVFIQRDYDSTYIAPDLPSTMNEIPDIRTALRSSYLGSKTFAGLLVPETFNHNFCGVNLHFVLPENLTGGVMDDDGNVKFPAVPDRFTVTRNFTDTSGNANIREFIVESNYFSNENKYNTVTKIPAFSDTSKQGVNAWRYLGRSYDKSDVPPDTHTLPVVNDYSDITENEKCGYIKNLTAIGAGDPLFASYYPSCRSVFGFCDKCDDVKPNTDVTYTVTAYYSDKSVSETVLTGSTKITWLGMFADYDNHFDVNGADVSAGLSACDALAAAARADIGETPDKDFFLCVLELDLSSALTEPDGNFTAEDEIHRTQFDTIPPLGKCPKIRINNENSENLAPVFEQLDVLEKEAAAAGKSARTIAYKRYKLYRFWQHFMLIFESSKDRSSDVFTAGVQLLENLCTEIDGDVKALSQLNEQIEKNRNSLMSLPALKNGDVTLLSDTDEAPFFLPKSPSAVISGRDFIGIRSDDPPQKFSPPFQNPVLFIDYEAVFIPVGDIVNNTLTGWEFHPDDTMYTLAENYTEGERQVISGRCILTPFGIMQLTDKLCDYLTKQGVDPSKIAQIRAGLSNRTFLSQNLNGFAEILTQEMLSFRFPADIDARDEPLANISRKTAPYVDTDRTEITPLYSYIFNRLRGGLFRISKLTVINSFGQNRVVSEDTAEMPTAQTFSAALESVTVDGIPYGVLPPAFTTAARLNAEYDGGELSAQALILPDFAGGRMMIYTDGVYRGALRIVYRSGNAECRYTASDGTDVIDTGNTITDNFISFFVSGENNSAFTELMQLTDTAMSAKARSSPASYIWGRPLLLSCMTVSLEFHGGCKFPVSKDSFGKVDDCGLSEFLLPLYFGGINRFTDGAIGIFDGDGSSVSEFKQIKPLWGVDNNGSYIGDSVLKISAAEGERHIIILSEYGSNVNISTGFLPVKKILPAPISKAMNEENLLYCTEIKPVIGDIEKLIMPQILPDKDTVYTYVGAPKDFKNRKAAISVPESFILDSKNIVFDGQIEVKKPKIKSIP
ncbi:MAG: hypothetical protein LBL98_04605 [Ruminococcus sp.]|jgi:hypothetical protein|nr:hypothetical protein [Ruminococcus sp.]